MLKIRKENIKSINLLVGFFLAFSGYYAALIVVVNLGIGLNSRNLTMPLRLIILSSFVFIFLLRPYIKIQNGLVFFLIFSIFYLTRILIEYLNNKSTYSLPVTEYFLYFSAFVLMPLLFISQSRLSEKNYNQIFIALIISTLSLSLLTVYFYKGLIGTVARISLAIKKDENYISPLALSYCSALGMGTGVGYLLTNKTKSLKKLLICSVIGISFIPFYLGASRGSILALIFPFVFYFVFAENVKKRASILVSMGVLSIVFILAIDYLGPGVFTRFIGTTSRIDSGTEARVFLFESSLYQFLENPIFGNSLENNQYNHYPHNIILEVLITTGIIGFIPFVLFLYIIFAKMRMIIKKQGQYFWICAIFLQAFIQSMFSGSIYNTAWLAIGAGMILGMNNNYQEQH